jgi:hypothetical protein
MPNERPYQTPTGFGVILPDRPGALAAIASGLRLAEIEFVGVFGFTGYESDATFQFIVHRPGPMRRFLESTDLTWEEHPLLFIGGEDRGDSVIRALERIAAAGINIRALHATTVDGEFGYYVATAPEHFSRLQAAITFTAP